MLPSKYPRQIPARRPTPPFHDPLSGRDMRSAGAEDGKRTGVAAVREGKRGSSPRKAGRHMPPRLATATARLEFDVKREF
jgi:hypothetical protein